MDVRSELEENLLRETIDIFSRAVATGVSDAVNDGDDMPRDEFLYQLKHNVEVFSAFRTHRMQNDIAAQLTDEKGQLKPFSRFAKDVQPYVRHQNRAWLRTEYDTAVRRAHQAADWQQFEAEKDVLPNLEWIPSTSPTPGADHRVFWGTVLPVDDPFWKEHRPGDRWNCKCELRNTDKDCTARPSGTEKDNPQSGLENNPGKDGHLFSDKHPYYPDSCAACQYSGNKLMALFHDLAGSKKHCNSCRKVEKVVKETKGLDERKDTNRKEYERLKQDPDYINVKYDKKSGGVKGAHKGHKKHKNDNQTYFEEKLTGDQLEEEFQDKAFKKGHSVIFRAERENETDLDMILDGVKMDLISVTENSITYRNQLSRKNSQLKDYNRLENEENSSVCMYFHVPSFYTEDKVRNGIDSLNRLTSVAIKTVYVMLNNDDDIFRIEL